MSVVVLEPLTKSGKLPPRLRCRCDQCGRVYVTNQWPGNIARLKSCAGCTRGRWAK